ncbi:MAG TPA: hypothetical protein VG148_15450 [Pyrinomonadaceae bacterium]|nr:hypothetical protein [Pyrinomonadaceae bacterium]
MITTLVLSLLLALAAAEPTTASINPVQHSEARAAQDAEADDQAGINPVQHSE